MIWVRRIGILFGVLVALLLAGAAWVWYAKPWIPKAELIDPRPAGIRVTDDGLLANFYPAAGEGKQPAVLVLGGSEGGLGSEMTGLARALQAEGYSALHLAYHRGPGLPARMVDLPLERFERALDWLKAQPNVDPTRIAIAAWSRGTEAAQLLAIRHPEIRALVLGMPANAVWAGFDWENPFMTAGAAWTSGGQPLPYMSVDDVGFAFDFYAPEWLGKMERVQATKPAVVIPIEQIKAQVLLVCAEKDVVWPSCPMSRLTEARAKAKGSANVRLLAYDDAGHYAFGVPVAESDPRYPWLSSLGGSNTGTNAALTDGWEKTRAFLGEVLKAPGE
ncbi:MAG: acyl-CoA thioester hydrolase/BAAT C-terminal domain-containing protein [Micropepsaceae bacterium]